MADNCPIKNTRSTIKQKVNTSLFERRLNKMTFKSVMVDVGRQVLTSLVFFAIAIFILNWSAYSEIGGYYLTEWFGSDEATPLDNLVVEPNLVQTPTTLDILPREALAEDFEIPPLDLEVAPIDDRIILPEINKNIPIIRVRTESLIKRDWAALENEMQSALQNGVVHYPGTSLPGQQGNVVITGHSSYFPWDPGRFKDVFALLHEVKLGDKVVIYYRQNKYLYEIDEIEVISPNEIDVLRQTPNDKLTLITCTPIGTNINRLIVHAKPIAINDKPITEKILR